MDSSPVNRPLHALCVLALCLASLFACGGDAQLEPAGPEALTLADQVAEQLLGGDAHGAFAAAGAALALYPRARELHVEYAQAAVATNRPGLAIDTWQTLRDSASSPAERHRLEQQIAHEALTHGLVERAATAVAALRALPEPGAFDLLLISLDAFERGELERALTAARAGRALDARDATLAYQLARAELALGQDQARATLQATLELDPGQDRAYFNLAQLDIEAGADASAEAALAKQATVRELTRKSFTDLNPKQRIQLASKVARELPEWSLPHIEIAAAQLELGQPRKAQETLDIARVKRPFNLRTIELSYAAARASNQPKEARAWLKRWREATGTPAN